MTVSPIEQLLKIMKALRDPISGCPWDSQQTFETIVPYTLEETYEVIEAISRQDFQGLRDELGDLLFQIVFYAQLGEEQGLFDFDALCRSINDKLERRHPHVFAAKERDESQTVRPDWEQHKARERVAKAMNSVLDDIPATFPALMKADKIQRRCASQGFDWEILDPVLNKVYEEIDEVMTEARQEVVNPHKLEEEIGDLLFAVVNLSRHLGHQAESALQFANRKFERRFRALETAIWASGQRVEQVSLDVMERYWQQIKQQE